MTTPRSEHLDATLEITPVNPVHHQPPPILNPCITPSPSIMPTSSAEPPPNSDKPVIAKPHPTQLSPTTSTASSTDTILSKEPPTPSFSKFSYRAASLFLTNAAATGVLGTGPAEFNAVDTNLVASIFQTVPWSLLFIELLWSLTISAITYAAAKSTAPDNLSTLSRQFWTTRINIPSSVTYSLGWALFVLLGFFIREASARYQEGQHAIHTAAAHLRQVVRILKQLYPPNTWHPNDLDRIVAHLVAYPIALKMTLRSERERCQLDPILHPHDVTDVLAADALHLHCSRVVRAYFSASEDDSQLAKQLHFLDLPHSPAGPGTRYFLIDILDAVDLASNTAVRVGEFRPAVVYVNHLRFFLYIWLMFLPLSLVQTSGWFTAIWSVLIAYSVSMLFIIAKALNEPYGFDAQDIKLNTLCAQYAHDCLIDYTSAQMHLNQVIDTEHDTPPWLEETMSDDEEYITETVETSAVLSNEEEMEKPPFRERLYRATLGKLFTLLGRIRVRPIRPSVLTGLFFVVVWSSIIIFSTWADTKNDKRMPGTRWWFIYLPIGTDTNRHVSLAVFLLLAFWVNDAYDRYWHALHIWQSKIVSNVEEVVFQLSMLCSKGMWHDRDRERIFSHLVALPYAAKLALRESRDLTDLEGVLSPTDIQALAEAPSLDNHVLNVIYGYINSADAHHETFHSRATPFTAAAHTMLYGLWSIENALNECHGMRKFPISPAFTSHLLAFTSFWLALLPMVLVLHDGFLSFVYIIPIAYCIINFVMIGRDLSDPFGFDEDDIPLDDICADIKSRVHRIYHETLNGPKEYVISSDYDRETFRPGVTHIGDASLSNCSDDEVAEEPTQNGPTTTRKVLHVVGKIVRILYVEVIEVFNLIPFVSIRVPKEGDPENPKVAKLKSFGMATLRVICFPFVKLYVLIGVIKHRVAMNAEKNASDDGKDGTKKVTFLKSIMNLLRSAPTVSVMALLLATGWCILAVCISYAISKAWDGDRQNMCSKWCSAIDVDAEVLATVGFALFLILTLRASDAIYRYQDGTILISNIEMNLRNVAVEVVQSFRDGCFHPGDKERIVAHVVQIPLCLRDMLLDIERKKASDKEGLLTTEDRYRFENSASPIDHLLQTVEAYFLVQDGGLREELMDHAISNHKTITITLINRISSTREIINQILGVKRFPVIVSYARHQCFFTAFWIALLPLSMTAHTGFFTILWAPLIAYGVLSLESIVGQLVDPYGHDAIDIPVNSMCKHASNSIIESVHSVDWDNEYHTRPSVCDSEPRMGTILDGSEVFNAYDLACVSKDHEAAAEETKQEDGGPIVIDIGGPREVKVKPSLLMHLMRSVPWWVLLAVLIWTIVACLISYGLRKDVNPPVRWWTSEISVSSSVMTYISCATFLLLGFFVQAALMRYKTVGGVWGDHLRASCHTVAIFFMSLTPHEAIHEADHERIIGHIAVLPLVLKAELRGSRDIREIKGLLSMTDVSRIECADSMAVHCVDVARSYLYKVICREEVIRGDRIKPQSRVSFVMKEIMQLEQLVRTSHSMHAHRIAPGFISLLNSLLVLWHAILPFAVVENSGWFTIAWVPLASFGLLGMYRIGVEMQDPCGVDVNDLDLDSFADAIVRDVVGVYRGKRDGWVRDVQAIATSEDWQNVAEDTLVQGREPLFWDHDRMRQKDLIMEALNLGRFAITRKAMVGTVVWTIISLCAAYAVSRLLPQRGGNELCKPWFCSAISMDDSLKEYVGFALFLLLGYRLYDSHYRYVQALRIWQDGIIGTIRLLTNRLFESYGSGTWHDGDLERISGHMAAFSICLMGALRGRDYQSRLRQVLGAEDVARLTECDERMDHCLDVVRHYLIDGERLQQTAGQEHPCGDNEHYALFYYLGRLRDASVECQTMVRIGVPFGYVVQVRLFMWIWLSMLPLGLVEQTGWVTILWMILIVYVVVGVDTWAQKLCDPFGTDFTDVPLERMNDRVVAIVKTNLHLFNNGMQTVICSDRSGFVDRKDMMGVTRHHSGMSSSMYSAVPSSLKRGEVGEDPMDIIV